MNQLAVANQSPGHIVKAGFFDLESFELMQRIAKGFATSTLVPKEYQGNLANCMIALNMAQRIGADPMMVMQSLVIVHGRPTWAAQFLIATANACGRFSALRFDFFGTKGQDDWGCRAWAVERATGQKLEGSDVTIGLAKKEGWYGKNGSKWQSMPQQMLMYRAGAWWVRAYAPELSMGLHTADEMADVVEVEADGSVSFGRASVPTSTGSVDMETGEISRPALPPYDQAKFNKNLPSWADAVLSGKKTVADILGMVQTKGTLSPEQIHAIETLGARPQPQIAPAATEQDPMAEHADFLTGFDAEEEGAKQ